VKKFSNLRASKHGPFKVIMSSKILGAIVIFALPLVASATEYQTVERPRQECWNEQVPVQTAYQGYGGAIVGGLAGGILGNQVGGGNGRTIATALGAVTGAVVGDRMSSSAPSYQTVKRCRTVVDQVQVPVMRPPVQYVPQPVQYISQPIQIIEEPPAYYVVPEEPHYREYWNRGWHGGHHRHHHDDDD
jgi:uncharacterized protein YcfJ